MQLARHDTSLVGRWWWTVDRWTLMALVLLMGCGMILMLAASPAAADRIGLADPFQLARRQLFTAPLALALALAISLFSPRQIRRIAVIGYFISLGFLALTLVAGSEIKGATRWISLAGLSIQPSEFIKPCLAVAAAWMFAASRSGQPIPGTAIAIALWAATAGLLLLQPDVGQTGVVSAVWAVQFFLAGLPLVWVLIIGGGLVGLLVSLYFLLPHVAQRIDSFIDPASGDRYQIERSLEAFTNGGLWGRGPGEGTVKDLLPDSHSDFIFAVAGEEFGVIACLVIVALFAFIVLRGFAKLLNESNLFILLAATGLLTQIGLQAIINMASSLSLIPTKGMTLPFISYGGSSYLALALAMGMLLALTRRRPVTGEQL